MSTFIAPGCKLLNKNKKPAPRAQVSSPTIERDLPSELRGTIGAEARIIGNTPTLVSGIGFMVGLEGTGGLTMPEQYAAHLERVMGLSGVTIANDNPSSPLYSKSPRQLLQDPNTAAVIVQAAIPPGSSAGDSYDVYVRAINATSLEGGKLWTTEMRIGPPASYNDQQARIIGKAKGPIFLNPFAEPGVETAGISRTVGRILDGGVATAGTEIQVILDNPSHQRVRQMVSAINAAYPPGPTDRNQVARGVDESLILIQIPSRFKERRDDFLQLISHMTIDNSFPEVYAQRYAQTLENNSYLANDMSWCLEALGERALTRIRPLYDHPEAAPRLAALRAGAGLRDPMTIDALSNIATNGPEALRTDAIALLARIEGSLVPDKVLRELLESDKLNIRIEAYEGLMARAINSRKRQLARSLGQRGRVAESSGPVEQQIDVLARVQLPPDPVRGVSRKLVAGKFFLDTVPFGEPLIYITQQKEPRIVLFGSDQLVKTPMLATAWSDRLMLASDSFNEPIRLYYRDDNKRRTFTHNDVPRELPKLVEFLAMEPTPGSVNRGLGLSYSRVVGALYEMYTDLGIIAGFTTEEDQLLADLLASVEQPDIEIRAEGPEDSVTMVPINDPRAPIVDRQSPITPRRTLLVPVNPPSQSEQAPGGQPDQSQSSIPTDSPSTGLRAE
ncbi:MAG: flagellar basal body P-ring protein FlgI [Phycisphaerales bacterium]